MALKEPPSLNRNIVKEMNFLTVSLNVGWIL